MSLLFQDPIIVVRGNKHLQGLKLFVPNQMVRKRITTWLSAEPETIQWIKRNSSKALLIDVGANIGLYSMYSALHGAAKVIAIEPDPGNLYVLNSNIWLNGEKLLSISVQCLAAYSHECIIDYFSNHPLILGHALNQVSQPVEFDNIKTDFTRHNIKVFATTVDSIVDKLEASERKKYQRNAILKIDVDSLELDVILGATRSLSDQFFKSILIELDINDPSHLKVREFLSGFGYKYNKSQVQASLKHNQINFPTMPSICNHIFDLCP